jgi:Flp pilus assembly protein TadG
MRRRTGQGLLELALVLPLLLAMVCGIIELARAVNVQDSLHRVTKEAVQYGTQVKADGTRPTTADVSRWLHAAVLPPLVTAALVVDELDVARRDPKKRPSVFASVSYEMPFITPLSGVIGRSSMKLASRAQLPYPDRGTAAASDPPPFVVEPDGTIVVTEKSGATIRVLGKQLQYGTGGPSIPVDLEMKITKEDDDDDFEDVFGGKPVNGGEEMRVSGIKKDERVAFRAHAKHTQGGANFEATYDSDEHVPFTDAPTKHHVLVLRNGDAVPTTSAFAGQGSLSDYLAPYVDPATGTMKMGSKDAVLLWEFNTKYNSPASDFQDLALLVQFD